MIKKNHQTKIRANRRINRMAKTKRVTNNNLNQANLNRQNRTRKIPKAN